MKRANFFKYFLIHDFVTVCGISSGVLINNLKSSSRRVAVSLFVKPIVLLREHGIHHMMYDPIHSYSSTSHLKLVDPFATVPMNVQELLQFYRG